MNAKPLADIRGMLGTDRPVIDLQPYVITQRIAGGWPTIIVPYVARRVLREAILDSVFKPLDYIESMPIEFYWLEFATDKLAIRTSLTSLDSPQPELDPHQTVEDYRALPVIELGREAITYRAVCKRIPEGIIGLYPLPFGYYFWTMFPKDPE